jgi:hypothetical protein
VALVLVGAGAMTLRRGRIHGFTATDGAFPSGLNPSRLGAALIRGDDHQSYTGDSDPGFLDPWGQTSYPKDDLVDLIVGGEAGPFLKCARLLHPEKPSEPNRCTNNSTTKLGNGGFTATDHIFESLVFKLAANWTPAGSCGPSSGNAMKLLHAYQDGNPSNRLRVDFENTNFLTFGYGHQTKTFTETNLIPDQMAQPPGTTLLTGGAGWNILSTWQAGEWWQLVTDGWRMTSDSGMQRIWSRQLTVSGAYDPQGWFFNGRTYTDDGSHATFDPFNSGVYFTTRNRTPDADMYLYVGAWEMVDATQLTIHGGSVSDAMYTTLHAMKP